MDDLNTESDFPKEIKTNNETNPLFDIISNIQEKLDGATHNTSNAAPNTNQKPVFEVDNDNKKTTNDFNIGSILQFLGSLNNNDNTANKNNPGTNLNLDNLLGMNFNTITKFSKLLNGFNQDDPRKNLLNSLKPFMRDTRKKNVDSYIFILGILNVLDNFGKGDSDNNGI